MFLVDCVESIKEITSLLKPPECPLSRPMQRKLISLLHCQLVDGKGRSRAMRNARSIGERALSELLIKHQDPHTLSANLWAAVRARGCQYLGPAMQEDVLRLVLLALEDGNALSRKVLVMFIVQRLSPHFPHQASKTAIGHVIQLLYRASCFKLTKRDGESSLMQLKEEYCSYDALRGEHDSQIVSIALEAGLRISPDQWSSLLYGDTEHKSHMQSIIDKLQSPQSFEQSILELVIALQRTGDPASLGSLKEHFEKLAQIDPGLNTETTTHPSFAELADILKSTKIVVKRLVEFLKDNASGTFKQSNRIQSYFASLNKNRVHRVKSHLTSCFTPASSPIASPIDKTFSYHSLTDHLAKLIDQRKNLTKPIKPLNNNNRCLFNLQNQGSLSLSVPSYQMALASSIAPKAKQNSYMPTSHSRYPPRNNMQSEAPAFTSIPNIIVDSSISHQSSLTASPTVTSYSDLTNERLATLSPVSFGNSNSSQSSQTCPLPSDEDQFIPFDEQPFVSKYGPISRAMNLINTPTMAGSSSNSRLTSNNLLGNMSTSTQPTNVIFGNRTALPPLTYIQPYQNLVLHTFMADGHKNFTSRNQTINDNNKYTVSSTFSPAVSLA